MRSIFLSLLLALVFVAVSGAAHATTCAEGFTHGFTNSKVAQWCQAYADAQGDTAKCQTARDQVSSGISGEYRLMIQYCNRSPLYDASTRYQCKDAVKALVQKGRDWNAQLYQQCVSGQ